MIHGAGALAGGQDWMDLLVVRVYQHVPNPPPHHTAPITQVQFQREHAPVFDVVIELQRGQTDAWTVYRPVADIVDAVYANKP